MKSRHLISFWMIAGGLALSACEAPRPVEGLAKKSPAATRYHYSPFIVQVPASGMVFDEITFKDVGLSRATNDPSDPVLEAIAQSVSYSLQVEPQLGVSQSLVHYDETLSDPANHASCDLNHLYVDVWNGTDRWGYSLWSGCSESDNFAWEEVLIPADRSQHIADRVVPLGESIAHTLAEAHQRDCYTTHC